MTASPQNGTEKLEGSVFTPAQIRKLKIAVVVMGVALLAGFALLVVGIVYQASKIGESSTQAAPQGAAESRAAPPAGEIPLPLKADERIAHIALDGDRMAVHVAGPGGGEIRVLDLASGAVVARVPLRRE